MTPHVLAHNTAKEHEDHEPGLKWWNVAAENVDCNGRVDKVVVTSEVSTRFPLVNTSLTMYKQSI